MIFQLTTSQGGRRKDGDRDDSHKSISTHDLARRSTEIVIFSIKAHFISTHDLARRSTEIVIFSIKAHFISTHDLARRSTKPPLFFILNPSLFQLTTSQGGRLWIGDFSTIPWVFQLTTSQGGRRYARSSRIRAESISTHDLARRSTLRFLSLCGRLSHFNSRPRKEVDLNYIITFFDIIVISTHDLARRSTAIFTQKVFLSKSLFVLIAYNIFILY